MGLPPALVARLVIMALAQVDEPAVWTELAHAQLDHGDVAEAIASYLRAGDSSRYVDVIARSQEAACYEELVKYLLMVRKKVKDNKVIISCALHSWSIGNTSMTEEAPNLCTAPVDVSGSVLLKMCKGLSPISQQVRHWLTLVF